MPADSSAEQFEVSADQLRAIGRAYDVIATALETGHQAASAQTGEIGLAFGGFEESALASAQVTALREEMDELVARHIVGTLRQMARRLARTADNYDEANAAGEDTIRAVGRLTRGA